MMSNKPTNKCRGFCPTELHLSSLLLTLFDCVLYFFFCLNLNWIFPSLTPVQQSFFISGPGDENEVFTTTLLINSTAGNPQNTWNELLLSPSEKFCSWKTFSNKTESETLALETKAQHVATHHTDQTGKTFFPVSSAFTMFSKQSFRLLLSKSYTLMHIDEYNRQNWRNV